MSGKRASANDLMRLLNAASQPIYALDEDLTIVFLNSACREWLGPAAEGLIGARAAYCSPADSTSPEGIAAGLCPPPEAIAGKPSVALVACLSPLPLGEGQGVRAESPANRPHPIPLPTPTEGWSGEGTSIEKHRRSQFIPLGTSDNLRGILAILEPEDCPGASAEVEASPAAEPGREALHAAIRRFRREAAGRFSADHLIGVGPAMQLARRQVEAAGASGCSVCISGPPGSGRERLASAIHYRAHPEDVDVPFTQGGLISLDCSVLPADLFLSSFAALARSPAAIELSSSEPRGLSPRLFPTTLVLHRVDELSAELQVELASLFSKKPFPRRLLSTAAAPLGELAQRGKFRADLAALLSTLAIQLPPLKDRREDLPLLAQIFLEDCNRRNPKQVGGFAPEALDMLDAYVWPGNLDELAAVVAAAHKNAQAAEIRPAELPPQIHLAAQAAAHPRRQEEQIRLDEFLERVERELIRRALARAKGNKTKAARLLGLTRPRLYRRMVQLGLEEA
ncbi:MAG: sigma 54-interacting transcriptional regulator [Pirellulales bacterium]|nr:sigma 54-interacting transcriptional regulator [Pirellulales bacterium]